MYAALTRNPTVVPVLVVVVSLLGFVGSVSVARYIGGMLLELRRRLVAGRRPAAPGRRGRDRPGSRGGPGVNDVDSVADVVAVACPCSSGRSSASPPASGCCASPTCCPGCTPATKPQVVGVLLIMVGGAIRLSGSVGDLDAAAGRGVLQLLTAPVSAHMVSRTSPTGGGTCARDLLLVDELGPGAPRGDAPADAPTSRPGTPPSPDRQRWRSARLTADTTAFSDAVTMFASMPTPHSTRSPTAHSTYAAARASPPADMRVLGVVEHAHVDADRAQRVDERRDRAVAVAAQRPGARRRASTSTVELRRRVACGRRTCSASRPQREPAASGRYSRLNAAQICAGGDLAALGVGVRAGRPG